MGEIKILDTHTINKIAAGEVVERPCSVVKELVENSIDAKASSITVEIKNGGIDFIRVTDNGVGIPKEDAEIAFLRHATSKITTSEDLLQVLTLGFRGEALASIAAISHVELITKTAQDITGKRVELAAGKISSLEEIACPNGTTLIIRHIFYNVPARKEFLKSSGVEAAKISDYMIQLALAHPEISFKYIQNNKIQFTTSGNHDLLNATLQIYGKDTAKHTFKFFDKRNEIACFGLLGKPSLSRANRNYEHFFINGRTIKSTLLQRAVEAAYKTLMMVGKFPFVILHLQIDPAKVDVNVHPTKMQVRFKEDDLLYDTVYEAVLNALRKEHLVPDAVSQKKSLEPIEKSSEPSTPITIDTFFTPRKITNTPTAASMLQVQPNIPTDQKADFIYKEEKLFGSVKDVPKDTPNDVPPDVAKEAVASVSEANTIYAKPYYHIIGQIFKTYWLIQYDEKVFLMDQHAAHERVMYEKFMYSFKQGEIATQLLLFPETLTLTLLEQEVLKMHLQLFTKLGFQFEHFGKQQIIIREVPFVFNQPLKPQVFKDILDSLSTQKLSDITDVTEDRIIRLSCRSAIKAHDEISHKECAHLIETLFMLDNPFTCPHGRPTLVALTKADIEKMFKRI